MDELDKVIKNLYAISKDKQLIRWLEEYKQLKYEIEYIKKNILPIPLAEERKERSFFMVNRLIDLYGSDNDV